MNWETGKEKIKMGLRLLMKQGAVRLFLWCAVLVYIIESLGRHSVLGGLAFFIDSPFRYIMNVALVMTPFTVFFMIRKRSIGIVLVSFAWLAIGITNGLVLAFRVTPFSTIDFRLVDAALGVIGNYMEVWQMILLGICIVLALAAMVFLMIKIKKYTGKMHYIRNAVLIAGYWLTMYFGFKALVHAGVFATVLPNLAYAYHDYGVSYCFVVTGMRNGIRQPIDYSEVKVEQIKEGIDKKFKSEKKKSEVKKPNIIFLQLESFFDITKVKNYYFEQDPIPYFSYLKKNYSSGYLTVPAFGAGTANTEFESMTGMKLSFFSPGEYPYKTILKKHTCESVPYDLKKIGYGTHVVHNNTASFYGRNKVFTNLGYDSFSTIETMDSRNTTAIGWAKDYILTDQIMDVLQSTTGPDYVYTISVQGHGDYYKENAQADDPEIMVSNVSEKKQQDAVNYYVEQIGEMDAFLKQLCEKLSQYDEDTILVMYGDHLPGLGFSDDDLINGDVFQTEYVIWSNFGLKKKDKDLSAYQLAAEVLNRVNIHEGNIIRYHQRYKGKKGYLSNLRQLQYDMLYGNQYIYDQNNPFLQTDLIFGVHNVMINSILPSKDSTMLYGSSFTQFSHAFVNGEEVDVEFVDGSALRLLTPVKEGDSVMVEIQNSKGKVLQRSNELVYPNSYKPAGDATTVPARYVR